MNILIFFGILAGVAIFGVGYLNNDLALWTQDYGIGDGDIPSPVMGSNLNILITRTNIPGGGHNDVITACEFTSEVKDLVEGTKIYCKLLQGPDVRTAAVIATGFKTIASPGLTATTPTIIDIDPPAIFQANDIDNVKSVLIEIQDPE